MKTDPGKPIRPARRVAGVTYAVRDVVVLADRVARSGKKMFYLNIGDPNKFDFATPPHIVEAICRALRDNKNSYSPSSGIEEAREAIRAEAGRRGIGSIRDIFVTTGATEAIDICFTALADEGENVLIPVPGYPTYNAILTKLGVESRPYFLDESHGWQPDLDDIREKIDSRTRAIVLINPNNPTGAFYDRDTVAALAGLAAERKIVLFSDEIYDRLLLDDREYVSPASLDPSAPVVTLNGMSKNYLAPGFRVGWGIISGGSAALGEYVEAVNKLLRARLCANHPEQWAIKPALEGDQSHLQEVVAKLTRRRDLMMELLNAEEGISCVRPEGAFYAFPRARIAGSDREFCEALLRETGVVVVPGSGFGQPPESGHFRVVFLPPEEIMREACEKIAGFYRTLAAGG